MTSSLVLWGKLALSAILAVLGVWALGQPRLYAGTWRTFVARVLVFAASCRAIGFAVLYLWLGLPVASDLPPAYYEPSRAFLSGAAAWPATVYGPFFPHLTALPLLAHDSPQAILAFMMAIELAALACWLHVGRSLSGEAVARKAGIAYALCPLPLLTAVFAGNNDLLVSLCIAGALLCFQTRSQAASAVLLALGVLTSKLLAGLAAPAMALSARTPIAWTMLFAGGLAGVYGLLAASGADFLSALLFHGSFDYSSGNLPFVLDALGLPTLRSRALMNAALALSVAGALLWPWRLGSWRLRSRAVAPMIGTLTLLFMLLSAKTYPHYLLCTLFAIFLVWASRQWGRIDSAMFVLFGVLVSIESSLWFRWLHNKRVLEAAADPAIGWGYAALFMAVEIALLSCYAWLLALCVGDLTRTVKAAREAP